VSCLDQTFSSLTVFLSWLVLFFFHPVHPVHPSPFTLCTPFTLCSPITLCSPFTLPHRHVAAEIRSCSTTGRGGRQEHNRGRHVRGEKVRQPCKDRGSFTLVLYLWTKSLDKIFGQNLWTKSLDNMNIYIDNDSLFLTMIILHG
jgi:hypothetical protein